MKRILITVLLAVFVGGCSQTILTMPDGSTLKRNRFLSWEKIGPVSYDEGSFTLDGYESDNARWIAFTKWLLAKEEVK